MSIEAAYNELSDLQHDDSQRRIVSLLDDLQQKLLAAEQPRGLRRWLPGKRRIQAVRGLYIWGGVGRGKTFLMDLFFRTLELERKKRLHFHRMMGTVHRELKALDDPADPLDVVAGKLAADTRVLCFDEFFVSDIGDAMILGRLLDGLFRRGVTLVATSNSPPRDLYRDGLQRQRFLPAIVLLETHTRIVELGGAEDYRLQLLEQAGTFLLSGESGVHDRLCAMFRRIASGDSEEGRIIELLGRPVRSVRSARGVAWFEFEEICGGPRSANDYVELAQLCHTVIVSDLPVLDTTREDEARRFIALVDELYDHRVKLILSAAAPVDRLYQGRRLEFEFERTRSRLVEMQSHDYLAAQHIA
ncbi:MAG: cell division protein ZapE [Woeseiaceae bacterium]|nr:cell division protein ZapE [Woeseiaceae bacterium]